MKGVSGKKKKTWENAKIKIKILKISLKMGKFPDWENISGLQYNGRKWTHMKAYHCDITEERCQFTHVSFLRKLLEVVFP